MGLDYRFLDSCELNAEDLFQTLSYKIEEDYTCHVNAGEDEAAYLEMECYCHGIASEFG